MSTAVSKVLACLLEKEVPYQLIPVNMSKGEHKMPEYLKIPVYNLIMVYAPPYQKHYHQSVFTSKPPLEAAIPEHSIALGTHSAQPWLQSEPPTPIQFGSSLSVPPLKPQLISTNFSHGSILSLYRRRFSALRHQSQLHHGFSAIIDSSSHAQLSSSRRRRPALPPPFSTTDVPEAHFGAHLRV
ncbi:hypothetical protein M0R45_009582 [Rubus argutus]|uniref:Uncharacterized protein n=1 Tax=Rubus argutus TaxID=59490 RepID=A0AAW1Y432_RUBAR